MHIVLDTNVLVSGLLNPNGAPGRILDLILGNRIVLLYDDRILGEYEEVLGRPQLGIERDRVKVILSFIRLAGEHITGFPLPADLLPDGDDLMFVEIAVSGKAEALVTGNLKHFIGLDGYEITVLSPIQLIQKIT